MDETRRNFLRTAGGAALGVGCGLPILELVGCTTAEAGGHGAPAGHQLAMVIDVEKTRLPGVMEACSAACHRAHNVPSIPDADDEVKWLWTERYADAFPDQTHAHLGDERNDAPVPVLCNHCARPSCVRVCPTKATWKRESDGIVMMDMHRCIGCRYCIAACPYGVRSFNWRDPRDYIERDEDGNFPTNFPTRTKGVVEKCNFCAERLRDGLEPACVEAAATVPGGAGAFAWGDLADADSAASRALRANRTIVRRAGMGTVPNVYYIV